MDWPGAEAMDGMPSEGDDPSDGGPLKNKLRQLSQGMKHLAGNQQQMGQAVKQLLRKGNRAKASQGMLIKISEVDDSGSGFKGYTFNGNEVKVLVSDLTKYYDPLDPDTDSDGMPDGWEVANGTDPKVDDAGDNPDGDRATNYEEYVAGTDPHNPDSVFVITGIERQAAPFEVTITWKSVTGKFYAIYYSDDEMGVGMSWTMAQDMIPASGTGTNTWTDDGTLTAPALQLR